MINNDNAKLGRLALATLVLALGAAGCGGEEASILKHGKGDAVGNKPGDSVHQPGAYAGGDDTTYDHMGALGQGEKQKGVDQIIAEQQAEGEPEVRTRLHSCQKMQIQSLRNLLTSLGVTLANDDSGSNPPTASDLLRGGGTALGAANYASRLGEQVFWTASGAAKQFDIFVQAAPEIVANLSSSTACDGVDLFDADDKCVADGITCLLGRPATPDHVALCNNVVESASTIEKGKNIAVASILSAEHSCE